VVADPAVRGWDGASGAAGVSGESVTEYRLAWDAAQGHILRYVGPVQLAIRNAVRTGTVLTTPSQGKPFWLGTMSAAGIAIELGAKRTPTFFTWECLEGVVPYLRQEGCVRINGSGKSQEIVAGTLDGYLKQHVNRLTAGWIAALLEKAGVVEIDRSPPACVRAAI
jgi:hypothetical protein